jgi:nitrite reductase/ring-hydroxylating ferredoxin subunit
MNNLSRRNFLNVVKMSAVFIGAGTLLSPIIAYFYPPKLEETPSDPVEVCPVEDLPVGTSKVVAFGRYPALVINTPNGLRAYSAVCTHFACITKWNPDKELIVCPCHEGYFNPEDGSVVSGPPPTPLTALGVEVVDGLIFVNAGEQA